MLRASFVQSSWEMPQVTASVESRKRAVDEYERAGDPDDPTKFYVVINGTIDSCTHPGGTSLYCRYKIEAGPDWEQMQLSNTEPGIDEGVTQVSERAGGQVPLFAYNLPFGVSYASTNAWGWPKLSVSVYEVGADNSRHPPMGYGWCHVPTKPGRHTVTIPLFVPVSSTPQSWLMALLQGHQYEFKGTAFSKEDNREVTRVKPAGATVTVTFNVLTKRMGAMGYH